MKRGIILFPLILFILSSCALFKLQYTTYSASYTIPLSKVERPKEASTRYGQPKIDTHPSEKYKYIFEDNMVRVLWLVDGINISFSIQNKTDQSIKIPWDEAAFVDEKSKSHRVIHSGVIYKDRAKPQAPSIIARKAFLEDFVYPSDYLYWKEGSGYSEGRWENKPLFVSLDYHGTYTKGNYPTFESFEQAAKSNVGKSIQVLLPLQIEDVINDYIFTFVVENVTCSQETKTR